jgi:hypothetical protein
MGVGVCTAMSPAETDPPPQLHNVRPMITQLIFIKFV